MCLLGDGHLKFDEMAELRYVNVNVSARYTALLERAFAFVVRDVHQGLPGEPDEFEEQNDIWIKSPMIKYYQDTL